MTFKEKWELDHPGKPFAFALNKICPAYFGYEDEPILDHRGVCLRAASCEACWNREMPGAEEKPHILDSGERRQFETGAVRDIQEGKGRCDLMPLRVLAHIWRTFDTDVQDIGIDKAKVFDHIADFQDTGDTECLVLAIHHFVGYLDYPTAFLEVAKHFEEGAKKYGENNWQNGLPAHCYIDSAVRHYLKWLRGDKDEPHDRAFVWNLMCCIWEVDFSPRAKKKEGVPAEKPKPGVVYICDREKCGEKCPNPDCHHTDDIRHAKNFVDVGFGVYEEKCPELTNAIARNPQITLRDCPVGLFEYCGIKYLKTGARYEDHSYCAIPVDTGVGVAIYSEQMVTRIRLKDYGVRERQTAIGDIEAGLFSFDDELWVVADDTRVPSRCFAYNLYTGARAEFNVDVLVNRVDPLTYERWGDE